MSDSREYADLLGLWGGLLCEGRGGGDAAAQRPHGGHASRGDELEQKQRLLLLLLL